MAVKKNEFLEIVVNGGASHVHVLKQHNPHLHLLFEHSAWSMVR